MILVIGGGIVLYYGLRYHLKLPRIAAQRASIRVARSLAGTALRLEALPEPDLGGLSHFAPLEPIVAGICGSDLAVLAGSASPYLAPLSSFPAVLGHEIVARLAADYGDLARGTRVVVDPSLACAARNLEPCPACREGREDACEARADPGLGPGLLLGFNRTLPGGWSTRMWAPAGQLYPIPAGLPSERAVLAEPLAIVAAGLDACDWTSVRRVLVIGAGSIGLLASWWVGRHRDVELHVAARYAHQRARLDRLLGRTPAFVHDSASFERLAGHPLGRGPLGAAAYYPQGADLVVDSVGSARSFRDALTMARPDGTILVLGALQQPPRDLTPVWSRRLTIRGSFGYRVGGASVFPAVVEALARAPELDGLVTSTWPLERHADAIREAFQRRSGSVKVAFRLQEG